MKIDIWPDTILEYEMALVLFDRLLTKPAGRPENMQSKQSLYLSRLISRRPIYIDWINCTKSEAAAVRKLWGQKLIRLVNVDYTSHVATYEVNQVQTDAE